MPDTLASRVISAAQLNDVGNGYVTVSIANPLEHDYAYLPPKDTTLGGSGGIGPDLVLAVTPNGNYEVRPNGTAGAWEKAKREGGWLIYKPGDRDTFKVPVE